jgi:hypothetical protein
MLNKTLKCFNKNIINTCIGELLFRKHLFFKLFNYLIKSIRSSE